MLNPNNFNKTDCMGCTIYTYESFNKLYDVVVIPNAPIVYRVNSKDIEVPNNFHNEIKKFYNIP